VIDAPTLADIQVNETNIRWYAAASGGTALPANTALVDGTTYYAAQFETVNNCESVGRLAIAVTVDDAPTPTTTDGTQDFCLVNNPTVGSIQVNQAGVVWYTAATGGTIVPNGTALVSGTTYYASLTDAVTGCQSSVRLAVTVTVGNAATPTTTDATQDFCLIDTPTVADIQVNEAGVVWYTAATAGTIVSGGTALVSGTTYYASLTDAGTGCASATRLAVTVTVGNAPTPTTTDTAQDFCLIDNPTIADIQVNQVGVVWYTAATGGSIVPDATALASGTTYYASLTDAGTGCTSATRLAVTVTVGNAATPTTTDATQDFCLIDNPTVADIQVNEAGVVWYTAATAGTVVPGGTALVTGTTYYASQTVAGCASATRLAVTVTVGNAVTPTTTDATQDFCLADSPTVADIQVNETNIVWYTAASGGSIVPDATALVSGTTYYASQTIGTCASATRLAVTVTVGNAPTPTTTDTTQDFCLVDSPTVADIQVNQAGVVWYTAATGGAVVPDATALANGGTYYASLTIGSCESATRLAVTVTVGNAATPTTIDMTQDFCAYADPTLASIQVNEPGVIWYNAATNGTVLANTTPLTNGTTYYAAIVNGSCQSAVRLAVTVTLANLCDVTLNLKTMLQGALYNAVGGLMRDNLRTMGLIPLNQPYSSALNARFAHVNGGGSEVTTQAVLDANAGTGDAIVDWVFVEIRNASAPQTVFKTVAALLQRDGDIVAADGGELVVSSLPETFFVAVKHRNHFGAMPAEASIVVNAGVTLDFTTLSDDDLYVLPGLSAGIPMATVNGVRAFYPGNANFDRRVKYDGVSNDRQVAGFQVLSDPDNTNSVLNFAGAVGYSSGDINMDGKVLYDGANNDRQLILNIVVTYPLNVSNLSNYNDMIEQLP
jgi:streptogramin lyase